MNARQRTPARRSMPIALALLLLPFNLSADDWPQWMGPHRDGVWRETGIIETIPTNGLPVLWRAEIQPGYVGPAVVGNRLFMLDRASGTMPERQRGDRSLPMLPGTERVLCLDTVTGRPVWEHRYECPYRIAYPSGPRATPVVADNRVFTLGAMGDLKCLDAANGSVVWEVNFPARFQLEEPPVWGWANHPLLDGPRLICLVGGTNSVVVAFDKDTGRELWRALSAPEIGYAPPMIFDVGGRRQLIVWHPDAVNALDPATGQVLWTQPYPVDGKPQRPEVNIAAPRFDGRHLFLTQFYHGATLLELTTPEPGVRVVWNRQSRKQSVMDDGLHAVMCTPWIKDGFIYGVCGFGELRCLELASGDRRWETLAATGGKPGLFANAFLVPQGDRCFLWNDQGELILARLTPAEFTELGRAKLLETTENTRGREVLWCHPAFAGRRAYLHNGRELICVDLAARG